MGDKPGHEFHGNQYTAGGGGKDWPVGTSRTFERFKVRDNEGRHVANSFNEIATEHPHDAAKRTAETSTDHTGLHAAWARGNETRAAVKAAKMRNEIAVAYPTPAHPMDFAKAAGLPPWSERPQRPANVPESRHLDSDSKALLERNLAAAKVSSALPKSEVVPTGESAAQFAAARAEYKKAFTEAAAKPKLTEADHARLAQLARRARS